MYFQRDLKRMQARYNPNGELDSAALTEMFTRVYGRRPFKPLVAVEILQRRLTHPVWRYLAVDRAGYNRKRKAKLMQKPMAPTRYQAAYWVAKGLDEADAEAKATGLARKGAEVLKTTAEARNAAIRASSHKISSAVKAFWADTERSAELRAVVASNLRAGSAQRRLEHFSTRPEYWQAKGYTLDEARAKIRQNARTDLPAFIKRYGEEEGRRRYDAMRASRAQTWAAMPAEVVANVNAKRSANSHVGIYTEDVCASIDTLNFYAFRSSGGIKYGLTKHDVLAERWPQRVVEEVLVFTPLSGIDAYNLERKCSEKYGRNYCDSIGTYEWFESDDSNEFCQFIEEEIRCLNVKSLTKN